MLSFLKNQRHQDFIIASWTLYNQNKFEVLFIKFYIVETNQKYM